MHVLFVLEYFPPHIGGVETLFDEVTKGLVGKGHEVTVLTSRQAGSKNYEVSMGRKIHRVGVPFRHAFAGAFFKAAKLAKKADIIHTTTYVAAGTTWLARKLIKKPVVATFHEVWGRLFFAVQNPIYASANFILEDLICRFYANDVLICPSVATKNAMEAKGIPGKNISVIPHGIDHDIFNINVTPLKKWNFPTYLFFGRPGVSKGLEYLIDAVPLIRAEVPGSKLLLMMSKTDMYEKMIRKIKKLGIESDVILLEPRGKREEVASVIKSADVAIVPSLSEGFGFSAVEAQACGVPVVASNAASLPEVVRGGVLVPPRDGKAIADAVANLLKDKKAARELGEEGSKFVKGFTWKRSVKEHLDLYSRVLS